MKQRPETPPKSDSKNEYELKTSSLKRSPFGKRDFSPAKSYIEMKESLKFANDFNLKGKNYGSIGETSLMGNNANQKMDSKFGFSPKTSSDYSDFSKADYTSTKSYQRLEDQSPKSSQDSTTGIKRSLLPNVRKITPQKMPSPLQLGPKGSRDSINSVSSSNNSNANSSTIAYQPISHTRTPPKFIPLHQTISASTTTTPSPTDSSNKPFFNKLSPKMPSQQLPKTATLPPNAMHAQNASLPPKPR
jgi:hypothetical protein